MISSFPRAVIVVVSCFVDFRQLTLNTITICFKIFYLFFTRATHPRFDTYLFFLAALALSAPCPRDRNATREVRPRLEADHQLLLQCLVDGLTNAGNRRGFCGRTVGPHRGWECGAGKRLSTTTTTSRLNWTIGSTDQPIGKSLIDWNRYTRA